MKPIFVKVGCVNKQNMRYWVNTNPQELHQRHSPKVTLWCVISSARIVEENEVTVTVIQTVCEHVKNFFPRVDQLDLGSHLIPTRRIGSHFKGIDGCFEGTLRGVPHLN